MSARNNGSNPEVQILLDLIKKIKSGQISPEALDTKTKIDCAELMQNEGYTRAQIAQVLRTSDRTITRYYKRIRKRNALHVTPGFAEEYLGELIGKVKNSIDFLIRLSTKEGKTTEKIQARKDAMEVYYNLTKTLQSAGYLNCQSDPQYMKNSDQVVIKVVGKRPKKGKDDQTSGTT